MLRKREGPPADPGLGFWANVDLTFQAIIVLCAKRCVAFAVFSAPPPPPPTPPPLSPGHFMVVSVAAGAVRVVELSFLQQFTTVMTK